MESNEYIVHPKSLPALVKMLSGYFSLTKKEAQVLSALIHIMKEAKVSKVDKDIKKSLCNLTNYGYQVTTNYVTTFKDKKALNKDGTLHPILTTDKIVISYGTKDTM